MASYTLLAIIAAYFVLLLALAWYTGRNATNETFFIGNRKSNWLLVAFGMVGTSLSGVTFISVPGTVGPNGFGYLQVVIGNWIGFMLIALVLLPLYYRLKLARLYLVVNVLQLLVADPVGMPFWLTTTIILLMIWLYTFQGGVKTIVFTDTLQTACMLGGLVICVWFLSGALNLELGAIWSTLSAADYTRVLNTDPNAPGFWLKQIIGGAFIAIAMTGLDQEMMQKNISVPNLRDAQKNMFLFSVILVGVNFLFLLLGGLLYLFATANGIAAIGDQIFPTVVMQHFPHWVQIIFFIALISALFPSADGALTALTSSFCIDILGIRKQELTEARQKRIRQTTHLTFALLFFVIVMVFRWLDDRSIIDTILKIAGYTYGPLLGLFVFGMTTRRVLKKPVGIVFAAVAAPVSCYILQTLLARNPQGFQIGIELLILNGAITFLLLWLTSEAANGEAKSG